MDIYFIKYFSALFFLGYVAVAFVVPSVRIFARTGKNPITFVASDNAHDFIGRFFKIILTLIAIVVVIHWIGGAAYQYLLPAPYLKTIYIQLPGVLLCILSLGWTVIAQWQMGNSWRIGIDEQNQTNLVTTGLFSISRNPIFFGMQITLVGFFLLLPNAIMLLVVVCGFMLIQIQARLEEEFLLKQHGEIYAMYKTKVNRFI